MQRYALPCFVFTACFALQADARSHEAKADPAHQGDQYWGMLKDYCTDCHNATDWAVGVAFDTMTPATVPDDAKTREAAVRKLRGHLMPPPGKPHPDA
jgi:hypothetical protein